MASGKLFRIGRRKTPDAKGDEVMITPELCKRFLEAKAEERKTKDRRLEVEAELVAAAGTLKVEGTTTTQSTGYKVVITTKVTRTLDYQIYSDPDCSRNRSDILCPRDPRKQHDDHDPHNKQ